MVIHKLKEFYNNLKIKNKLFLILFTLILFVSVFNMFSVQISYNIYDGQLINQSSVILNLYSTNIENELRKIEALTFSILSDHKVQSHLKQIKNDASNSYERTIAINEFTKRLMAEAQTESYISSIGFIDNNGTEYSVGRHTKPMNDSQKNQVITIAKEESGGIAWMSAFDEENHIIAAREIRATENMEPLAVLLIRLDLENLVNRHISMESRYKPILMILSGETAIFGSKNDVDFSTDKVLAYKTRPYYIENINAEKYLIYYGVSNYTNWTYVHMLPYENIFYGISIMRTVMIAVYAMILLAFIFIGVKFANGITKPIIALSSRMKMVEHGNFDIIISGNGMNKAGDEIGQLEYDFKIMVNRINALINENYVKQLLIKEWELKTLQSQINPHFLYNTLASINGLAKMNGQDKISTMVKALGNLLRCAIKNKEIKITIKEEMGLLNDYIAIQKIRYGERLNFETDIDQEILDCSILKLTLQPIVENSIQYGLENLTGICNIKLKGYRAHDFIIISISDNGIGMSEDLLDKLRKMEFEPKGFGVGLKNINERIKLIFGDKYGLSFESKLNEGATVHIHLPIES